MAKLNLLITGRTGFLGRELETYLKNNEHDMFNILTLSRFDLTDLSLVERVLKENSVDVVIHTAAKGGKRSDTDNLQDLIDNVMMFNNLVKCQDHYKLLFCFCSGAAFDREKGVGYFDEDSLLNRNPVDYYGLSKNIIARECLKHDKIFTFRLFGCFGKKETPERFFSSLMRNILNSEPMIIHEDRFMDFFSAEDVGRVLEYYLNNYMLKVYSLDLPKDLNLVYSKKYRLSTLASKFGKLLGRPDHPIITEKDNGLSYTGCGDKIRSLGIKLEGLEEGLVKCYASS